MKKMFKKSVAIIEAVAMTLVMAAGLSFTVSAEEVIVEAPLIVNEAVEISIADGDEAVYTFTAPADDTYYFTTIGDYDTYGTLLVDEKSIRDDDSGRFWNFLISVELKKDETCQIYVKEYSYGEVESILVVYDSKTASITPLEWAASTNGNGIYIELGDTVTLCPKLLSYAGAEIEYDPSKYTFIWYKYSYNEDLEESTNIELEETSNTYIIDQVTEDNLRTTDNTYYYVEIYEGEDYIGETYFNIIKISDYVEGACENLYVSVGDDVTLEAIVYDYYGNKIDLNSNEYTIEWYKYEGEDWIYLTDSEITYTINDITEEYYYDRGNNSPVIFYVIYINGNFITGEYYIYDKSEEPTTEAPTTEAPTTEAPTTVAPTTVDPASIEKPSKVAIKKANKKPTAKKASITLKAVKGATGYEIAIYKTKKNAKKNKKAIVTVESAKVKVIVKSKKLKKAKKLFVRARAYVEVGEVKVTGKWSKVKKVNIK